MTERSAMTRIAQYVNGISSTLSDYAETIQYGLVWIKNREASINGMNKIIDNLEDVPAQVKEKIFRVINQDKNQSAMYIIEENAVVVKNLRRCRITR